MRVLVGIVIVVKFSDFQLNVFRNPVRIKGQVGAVVLLRVFASDCIHMMIILLVRSLPSRKLCVRIYQRSYYR